jgi:PAS domain S-box-containing protein
MTDHLVNPIMNGWPVLDPITLQFICLLELLYHHHYEIIQRSLLHFVVDMKFGIMVEVLPVDNLDPITWRVLHVVGDEDDYLLTREMLSQAQGRKIILDWASTYKDGQLRLQSSFFDAVLVDHDLDLDTGIEFIREAISQGYSGPLILCSELDDYEVDIRAMDAGADLYLPKTGANPLTFERSLRYAIERKHAEKKPKYILESIQDGFLALDRDWSITYINHQAALFSNFEPEELTGRNFWEAFPNLLDTPVERNYRLVMDQPESIQFEMQPALEGPWYKISVYPSQAGISAYWQDITEHKLVEKTLRFSVERFAKTFNAAPNALVISRLADGQIEMINDSFERLFGFTRAEVIGKTSLELNMFADPAAREVIIHQLRSDHFLRNYSTEVRIRSGDIRQVELSVEMLTIDTDNYIFTIIVDITERNRAEKILRESERQQREMASSLDLERSRLAAVIENLPVGIWIADQNGQLIGKNQMADQIWAGNAPLSESIEKYQEYKARFANSGKELQPEEYPVAIALRTGQTVEPVEMNIIRYDGTEGTVLVSAQPIMDDEGQLTGVVGVNVDISDRKQVEEALQQSEVRFRQLADAMPQLVWTAEPDGKVDYYNQRYQEYHGILPNPHVGWDWAPVLHPDDVQATVEAWQRSVESGETYQIEHRVRMANGEYRWHLSRAVSGKDENGQTIKWFGTATDIHDVKQVEDVLKTYTVELERSNRDLQEFAFVVSHDLQEPLRKIETLGDMIAEGANNLTEQQRDKFDRLRKSTGRMRHMVDGLLQLSRLSTRAQPFQQVDLSKITEEVLSDLELRIKQTGGVIEVGELPVIEADPVQMRQLFQNLVGNALKFQPPGGKPHVKISSCQPTPVSVQISVTDNGIGFDESHMETVFQPFKRLVGRSEYEGSGIGLAISRKIIERHAGEITARSTRGKGATFIITLPIEQNDTANY